MNKSDLIKSPSELNQIRLIVPGAIRVSAFNTEDVKNLRDKILNHFKEQLELWDLVLPYSESKLESQLYDLGIVEQKKFLEKGTYFQVRIHKVWAKRLNLERYHLKTRSISQPG